MSLMLYVYEFFCTVQSGITLTSLLASEKTVSVEAEVKEKRWWLKGSIPVEVATEIITFLRNMTKVIIYFYKVLNKHELVCCIG